MLNQFKTIAVDSKQEYRACCKYVYDQSLRNEILLILSTLSLIYENKIAMITIILNDCEGGCAASATIEKPSKMNLSDLINRCGEF